MTLFAPRSTSGLIDSNPLDTSINATTLELLANPSLFTTSGATLPSQPLGTTRLETRIERFAQGDNGDRPTSLAQRRSSKAIRQIILGKKNRILGTVRNDILDASKGKGRNVLLGKGGNDTLKGKTRDRLLGGGGRDRLDTRKGRKNMLKGGGGNDTLFAGKQDMLLGNGGADILDASKGRGGNILKGGGGPDVLLGKVGDRLVGGNGSDEFVIVNRTLPTKPLIIEDFQQDSDRLGVRGTADPQLSAFVFRTQGQNTVVSVQGTDIAILENVTQVQPSDFREEGPESPSTELIGTKVTPTTDQSRIGAPVKIQHSNQYSVVALDAQRILFQFDVADVNASGTAIPDVDLSANVGVFLGAIKNYVSGQGILSFGVDAEPFLADGATALDAIDLRAEGVQNSDRNAFVSDGRDTIEYVFTTANDVNSGSKELLRLSLDFTSNLFAGLVPNFDRAQAINSLDYILQNDLLAYGKRVQTAGPYLFEVGSVQNTQANRTYTQSLGSVLAGLGQAVQFNGFRLVGSQKELIIEDQNASAIAGIFVNAIENFVDGLTGQSFKVGNLSASLKGTAVTYAISNGTVSRTAILNLAGTSFDPELAVNNLSYILTNDLLQRAFFA